MDVSVRDPGRQRGWQTSLGAAGADTNGPTMDVKFLCVAVGTFYLILANMEAYRNLWAIALRLPYFLIQ
jgi:hypothetical protein